MRDFGGDFAGPFGGSPPGPMGAGGYSVAQLLDRPTLTLVYLVEITLKNSCPFTLYLSDRNIEVNGVNYDDYLNTLSGLGEKISRANSEGRNTDITLRFINRPYRAYDHFSMIGDDYPFEGATCVIKVVYLDNAGNPSTPQTIFQGAMDERANEDEAGFECQVSTEEFFKDLQWQQDRITKDAWPQAHEDLGKFEPIVYGENVMYPCPWVDAGARTTLVSGIDATQTTGIKLSDVSRFPSFGTLLIDDEEIAFGGFLDNELTGVTRGTATAHSAGAEVWEIQAVYKALAATHGLHSIHEVFAEFDRGLLLIESGWLGVLDGGKQLLRAFTQITTASISDTVAVLDTIDVDDSIVVNDTISVNDGSGVSDTIAVTNTYTPAAKQVSRLATDMPSQANLGSGPTGKVYANFPSAPSGTLSEIRTRITVDIQALSNPTAATYVKTGSDVIAKIDTDKTVTWYMPQTIDIAHGSWQSYIYLSCTDAGGANIRVTISEAIQIATSTNNGDPAGGIISKKCLYAPVQEDLGYDQTGKIYADFPSAPSGTLSEIRMRITLDIQALSNPPAVTYVKTGSDVIAKIDTAGVVTWYMPKTFEISTGSWLTYTYLSCTDSGSPHQNRIRVTITAAEEYAKSTNEADLISAGKTGAATKTGAVTKGGAATKSGTASKTGAVTLVGAVVGTHQVRRFHILANGMKDPDGYYGGAGTCITLLDYAIKHFLVQMQGYPLASIDLPSFNAAGAFYYANNYKAAFVIDRRITPSKFKQQLAAEFRSVLFYHAGKWYLYVIPDAAPAAVKTIYKAELVGKHADFNFNYTPATDIANKINADFKRDYSTLGGQSQWLGTASDSDSASQTRHGTYPLDVEFEFVREQAIADSVIAHMLKQQKELLQTATFRLGHQHFDLNRGDTIELDTMYGLRKFYIQAISRPNKATVQISVIAWWT